MSEGTIDVRYQNENYTTWYPYDTHRYLSRPRGYYFHLDDHHMCYGPLDSAKEATKAFERWLKVKAGNV